jgi:DNA-binding PadR family transcriptional regulator
MDRISETAALILISLAEGPRHGTAMLDDVQAVSGRSMAVGTLYGTLDRLIQAGLVVAAPADGRRQPYELTPAGTQALSGYLAQARTLVQLGTRRLAFG